MKIRYIINLNIPFAKTLVLIFAMTCTLKTNGQYSHLKLKEQFEYIIKDANFGGGNIGAVEYIYATNTGSRGQTYGDNLGYVNDAYITLYKTTRDKAYLYKAISLFFTAITERFEYPAFGTPELLGWCNDPGVENTTRYQDGLVLWPMSRFVYLVLVEEFANLYYEPINDSYLNNNPGSFNTFGEIAEYISDQVQLSLDSYIYYYWDGCFDDGYQCAGGFTQIASNASHGVQAINMQSTMATTSLYMGLTYNNSWLQRAKRIGENWKKPISITDPCGFASCLSPLTYSDLVIKHNSVYNAYTFYDNGWRLVDQSCFGLCSKDWDYLDYTNHFEDISHAIQTLIFLHPSYENDLTNYLDFTCFSSIDMVRFRNMFTKVIFDLSSETFHNNVNGSDFPVADENCSSLNCYKYQITGFMPFYKYDDADPTATTPNVYDIVMNFYEDEVYSNPVNGHGGGTNTYGLAHCVAAQWDKECPNLTLYKRNLTYNQDFFSKNCLIVDPNASTYSSFAEPIISTPDFIIANGITSNMVAANEIVFKDGFTATAGCDFTASIDATLCGSATPPCFAPPNNSTPNITPLIASSKINETFKPVESVVLLTANANELSQTISLLSPNTHDKNQYFEMRDLNGKLLLNYNYLPTHVSTMGFASGIYILHYRTEKGITSKKIFLK